MVEFVFISGYNPLTPYILLLLVLIHALMLAIEPGRMEILGGYFDPVLIFTTAICILGSPLAMGIFVGWRVPVMLLAVFAAVLLGSASFAYSGSLTRFFIGWQKVFIDI